MLYSIYKYIYIIISFAVYICGFVIGSLFSITNPINENSAFNNVTDVLIIQDEFQRFVAIAINNLKIELINMIMCVLSIGIFSFLYSFYNGFCLGSVYSAASNSLAFSDIFFSFCPHCGEIICFILSGYIGFVCSIKILFGFLLVNTRLFRIMCVFVFICTILFAFIESYISMSL